jgi:hypothetical protein
MIQTLQTYQSGMGGRIKFIIWKSIFGRISAGGLSLNKILLWGTRKRILEGFEGWKRLQSDNQ